MTTPTKTTHEDFLQAVRNETILRALDRKTIDQAEADLLLHTKLVYGAGLGLYRGICHYESWENGVGKVAMIEVAATAEESWVQLTGTTIHELAHVLAGWGAGHGPDWKAAAVKLGFTIKPLAAGQVYHLSMFEPRLRERAWKMAQVVGDGSPAFQVAGTVKGQPKPCTAGHGTKGGKSRGTGAGSRHIKVVCPEDGYTVRTSRKWLDVGLPSCPAGHEMAEEV